MNEGAILVDLVDEAGEVTGQKRRGELDELKDIYHAVHVIMITPAGEVVLSEEPDRKDFSLVYKGKLTSTAVAVRRAEENSDETAIRALSRGLYITEAKLQWLGDRFNTFSDGLQNFTSTYYLIGEMPAKLEKPYNGLYVVSSKKLKKMMLDSPKKFAPSFVRIWETYSDQLPL